MKLPIRKKKTVVLIVVIITISGLIIALRPGENTGDQNNQQFRPAGVSGAPTDPAIKPNNEQANDGSDAPVFESESLNGKSIKLEDSKGKKPVILDFFATWCENCQENMRNLNSFSQEYSDQVTVIGINIGESEQEVKEFIEKLGVTYEIVIDSKNQLVDKYAVFYTNYHVLIDSSGKIMSSKSGNVTEDEILNLIKAK